MTKPKALAKAIGERLREIRHQNGRRQEEIATAARGFGLSWTRPIVAAIETGRRSLAVEELLLLPSILSTALQHRQLTFDDLLPTKDWISMTSEIVLRPGVLKKALASDGALREDRDYIHVTKSIEVGREMALAWKLKISRRQVRELKNDATADATVKAASRLKMLPFDMAIAARKRWGRSLAEERDRRISEQRVKTPRTIQALRGHVTRQLLKELVADE